MALNGPILVVGSTAIEAAIGALQLYSDVTDVDGVANAVGARVAVDGAVDSAGNITWTDVDFTGLDPEQPVPLVGFWSALTGGTFYGTADLTGDPAASAAGEHTITSLTVNVAAADPVTP